MEDKRTLYEVLGVPPNASTGEIRSAYQRERERLESQARQPNREDADLDLQMLNLALDTLLHPVSREMYDAKLKESQGAAMLPSAAAKQTDSTETALRRAEVLALRAEALSLRADSMAVRVDMSASQPSEPESRRLMLSRFMSGFGGPLKRVTLGVGTVLAAVVIVQMMFTYFAVRKNDLAAAAAANAEEKAIIQEHYQTYGVRPASAAEARLLENEHRREEEAQREAEREQERRERQEREFREESRRIGEQVSADLRRAEEEERREEERKQMEERRRQEAENDRIERQREKWEAVLRR